MRAVEFTGRIRRVGRSADATCFVEIALKNDDAVTENQWLQLSTADVQSWAKVRRAVFAATNLFHELDVPRGSTPQSVWERSWNEMERGLDWEDAPPEASEAGLLLQRCMEFVTTLRIAETADEFEAGGWRYETPAALSIFRSRDLLHHLQATGKLPPARELWAVLQSQGFGSGIQKVGKRTFRVWWLQAKDVTAWVDETEGKGPSVNGSEPSEAIGYEVTRLHVEELPM